MKKEKDYKYKVFSIGYGDGGWIKDSKATNLFDESDIVVFPGGADIQPEIYGEKAGRHTGGWAENDDRHINFYKRCIEQNKYMVGICRGHQLINALQPKGKLIQHVTNHHGGHMIKTAKGEEMLTNSIHHQMVYPWNMDKNTYTILGWCEGNSTCYLDGDDKQNKFPVEAYTKEGLIIEPEIIFLNKVRALTVQFHP